MDREMVEDGVPQSEIADDTNDQAHEHGMDEHSMHGQESAMPQHDHGSTDDIGHTQEMMPHHDHDMAPPSEESGEKQSPHQHDEGVMPSHGHDSMDEMGAGHEEMVPDHGSMEGMQHDHDMPPHHGHESSEGTLHMHDHGMGGEVMAGLSPASPLWMGIILLGAVVITLLMLHRKRGEAQKRDYPRLNLLNIKFIKRVVMARPFQFVLQFPVMVIFIAIIITGLLGNQHPGSNLATVASWTIWWSLIIFIILFFGASWCLICPWSAISDWIERLALWKRKKGISLGYRWPRTLRSRHPMTLFFIVVTWLELGVFITYNPRLTALFSIGIILFSLVIAMIFARKSFCRYLCFVGGIIGTYANLAPVEIRSKEKAICDACRTKDCIMGNENGYPCPIYEYPGGMKKNINCILCTECLKTCPSQNMTINVRPFFTDLSRGFRGRYDEALLALTLLGLTIYHGFTMLPIWFGWAVATMKTNYPLYIITFTVPLIGFIAVPVVLHYLTAWFTRLLSGRRDIPVRQIFVHYAYALLP
ncbi:MAG: 4Fe-4S binding protein, partial [Deltaproteobacteria bacterium]|nr:4Fe-4S binding protein [Deltaproteobacteria bacterium]